jgi:hypothetical protein
MKTIRFLMLLAVLGASVGCQATTQKRTAHVTGKHHHQGVMFEGSF